jgi:hypothetical protein
MVLIWVRLNDALSFFRDLDRVPLLPLPLLPRSRPTEDPLPLLPPLFLEPERLLPTEEPLVRVPLLRTTDEPLLVDEPVLLTLTPLLVPRDLVTPEFLVRVIPLPDRLLYSLPLAKPLPRGPL